MALELGINSYVDVETADLYFEDKLDVAAWTLADIVMKSQALVMATSTLEGLPWSGTLLSPDQPMCWPRKGEYYDVGRGTMIQFPSGIPKKIIAACCELAYHYLNNDGIFDETGSILNLKIDVISLDRITPPSKLPKYIREGLAGFTIRKGNSRGWWRAN
jgi:hypothetical protein